MPHLQFEFNFKISVEGKSAFARKIMSIFSELMDTGTGHIGVTIRDFEPGSLVFGRVEDIEEKVAYVNADIRQGRDYGKRRILALKFIDEINRMFDVPQMNVYVIFTEHKGEDFHLYERALKDWQAEEDPLKD